MIWVCAIMVAFAAMMCYWNRVLGEFTSQCGTWVETVTEQMGIDPDWSCEMDQIQRAQQYAYSIELGTQKRIIPYYVIFAVALITLVVSSAGMTNVFLNFVLAIGMPFLILTGVNSRKQYFKLKADVQAVGVVLAAKINYDGQIAKDIQGILDDDA